MQEDFLSGLLRCGREPAQERRCHPPTTSCSCIRRCRSGRGAFASRRGGGGRRWPDWTWQGRQPERSGGAASGAGWSNPGRCPAPCSSSRTLCWPSSGRKPHRTTRRRPAERHRQRGSGSAARRGAPLGTDELSRSGLASPGLTGPARSWRRTRTKRPLRDGHPSESLRQMADRRAIPPPPSGP